MSTARAASSTPAAQPGTPAVTPNAQGVALMDKARAGKPLWATLETSSGKIVLELQTAAAPQSTAAFVGYATGGLVWQKNKQPSNAPLYDGTIFHRVIPGFAIQAGDPTGTGTGGPGATTPDESASPAQKALHFTKGTVGLSHVPDVNANGSQFFITLGDAPWLDGRFTQIGKVVAGQDVADAIGATPRGPNDRPLQPVTLKSVRISDKAPPLPKAPKKK
ncbi:MAG: peptidylprolyl isomerase [Deltaproteobacteria bacterium]|nr:peptidylprolyl isomerase [Deltaproteobacteria bacterium]